MKVKINNKEIDAQHCAQIAFRGDSRSCQSLCGLLEKEQVSFTVKEKNESLSVVFVRGLNVETTLELVKKFPQLKECAFFDEFKPNKIRDTYIVYSESGTNEFKKIIYVGSCDGQGDSAFSEEAFLLETKTKKFSGTMTSTGEKWNICYSFPFVFDWEDKETDQFEFYGTTIVKYKGIDENVVVPIGVTRIDVHAFKGNSKIKNVMIPKSVQYIMSGAFSGCTNLEHVEIEKGIQYIPNLIFKDCKNLIEICFPDSISKAKLIDDSIIQSGQEALCGCKKLEKVVLSNKMKTIPDRFFKDCESLDDVVIPEQITQIGALSFAGCKSLKKIVLPNGVKSIGNSKHGGATGGLSFQNCSALSCIFIPDTVTKIAKDSFKGCKNVIIYTPKNSYAEKYSIENNIKCVLV